MNLRYRFFLIIINFNQVFTHVIASLRNLLYKSFFTDSSGEVKDGLPLVGMNTICKVPVKAPGLESK